MFVGSAVHRASPARSGVSSVGDYRIQILGVMLCCGYARGFQFQLFCPVATVALTAAAIAVSAVRVNWVGVSPQIDMDLGCCSKRPSSQAAGLNAEGNINIRMYCGIRSRMPL